MVKRGDAYVDKENLAARTGEWLVSVRSSFPPRPQLQLNPSRCALLVVDMQNYFATPSGRAYLPASSAIVPNITRLILAWKRPGGATVFTRHCHKGAEDLGMLGRFFNDHIRDGFPESRILPELSPAMGELVVEKTTYDAFHNTDLEEKLRSRGITQILVTGVLTNLCCETTARSAFVRGFEVYFVADATASASEALHVGSLCGLAHGVAVMLSTDEVLGICSKSV